MENTCLPQPLILGLPLGCRCLFSSVSLAIWGVAGVPDCGISQHLLCTELTSAQECAAPGSPYSPSPHCLPWLLLAVVPVARHHSSTRSHCTPRCAPHWHSLNSFLTALPQETECWGTVSFRGWEKGLWILQQEGELLSPQQTVEGFKTTHLLTVYCCVPLVSRTSVKSNSQVPARLWRKSGRLLV